MAINNPFQILSANHGILLAHSCCLLHDTHNLPAHLFSYGATPTPSYNRGSEYVRVVKWVRALPLILVAPVRIPVVCQSMIGVAYIQLTISNNCETALDWHHVRPRSLIMVCYLLYKKDVNQIVEPLKFIFFGMTVSNIFHSYHLTELEILSH